jgi:hypothetical protein
MADEGVAPALSPARAAAWADSLRPISRLVFGVLVVLSPFRARIVLEERPLGALYGDYTDFLLYSSDVLLIGLLLLWGLSLALQPRRVWLGPALVRWPVIGLVAAIWLSVPFSVDASLSLYNAVRLTGVFALALYCANEIEDPGQVVPFAALAVLVQAIVGVAQVIDQHSLGLWRLGERPLDPAIGGISVVWTEGEERLLRAYGLTDHPNILGGLVACGLLLITAGLTALKPHKTILLSAVFSIGALVVLVSFSRAAWISFGAGLALVFALLAYQRNFLQLNLLASACIAALLIGAAFVQPYAPYLEARANPGAAEVGSTEERSISEREALAQKANEIFVSRPVAGVGVGTLSVAMFEKFPDFGYFYQPAHFVLLDVAAETGLLGAFFYAWLLIAPWVLLWWRRRQLTVELIAVSGALLTLSATGLFDYYTWGFASGQIWWGLVLGLWLCAYRRVARSADA